MKIACVSRSTDVATGLRLAGIETYTFEKEDDILNKIRELFNDGSIRYYWSYRRCVRPFF